MFYVCGSCCWRMNFPTERIIEESMLVSSHCLLCILAQFPHMLFGFFTRQAHRVWPRAQRWDWQQGFWAGCVGGGIHHWALACPYLQGQRFGEPWGLAFTMHSLPPLCLHLLNVTDFFFLPSPPSPPKKNYIMIIVGMHDHEFFSLSLVNRTPDLV